MPFLSDWHQQDFAPGQPGGFPTSSLSWWWTQRATFAPEKWQLALAVRLDGVLVGMQDMSAKNFLYTRTVETGSWLGRSFQGRGIGTLMRQMAVEFAFEHLDAETCISSYVVGNHASAKVSRKLGYVETERRRIVQRIGGETVGVEEQRVVLTPATYRSSEDHIEVEGAAEVRTFLGLGIS